MLSKANRINTEADFRSIMRSGARASTPLMVVSLRKSAGVTRVGFVVSKAVGNAVVRNVTKRRLREVAAEFIALRPEGCDVVVRLLPGSGDTSFDVLRTDFLAASKRALGKVR